jgi:hypothetical protein
MAGLIGFDGDLMGFNGDLMEFNGPAPVDRW